MHTLENESPIHVQDVKNLRRSTQFKKYSSQGEIENTDWFWVAGMPIFLRRFDSDFIPARNRQCRKMIVKVSVLREGETFLLLFDPNEVPKNFLQLCIVFEHL